MKLIVGLGNTGEEYTNTRHNVGFLFLDYARNKLNLVEDFRFNKKLDSETLKTKEFILVKPSTFMNDSGVAVNKIKSYYTIALEDLVIIHDDIDQTIGRYKIVPKGGSGGHKGVASIIKHLNIEDFKRVKIGIAPDFYDPSTHKAEDFVLKNFSSKEIDILQKVFDEIFEILFNKNS